MVFLFNVCNKESDTNVNNPKHTDVRLNLQNPPSLDEEYNGSFYCLYSSGKMSFSEYEIH